MSLVLSNDYAFVLSIDIALIGNDDSYLNHNYQHYWNSCMNANDIKKNNIVLTTGLKIMLDDDDGFAIEGTVEFSTKENIWVAKFDWDAL